MAIWFESRKQLEARLRIAIINKEIYILILQHYERRAGEPSFQIGLTPALFQVVLKD